jgi:hypothetical protein
MNRRIWCSAVVVAVGLPTVWGIVGLQSGALPGRPASPEVVAAIRAGQTRGPCEDNGVACTGNNIFDQCVKSPNTGGGCTAASLKKSCGTCTGANHKVCKSQNESACSELSQRDACCEVSRKCRTEGPPPSACNCSSEEGTATKIGSLINCN